MKYKVTVYPPTTGEPEAREIIVDADYIELGGGDEPAWIMIERKKPNSTFGDRLTVMVIAPSWYPLIELMEEPGD